jgi:uncharacterized membrane protein (UPF0127 family)
MCNARKKIILVFAFHRLPMTHPPTILGPSQRTHRPVARFLAALVLVLSGQVLAQQAQPQLNLPRMQLSAGMHLIDAQVAQTPEQRQIGLMHRKEMPVPEGMLFVFEQPAIQCFWMKSTLLPLTAAFVADDGRVVNLVDMKPQTTDSHCSVEPVRYVLEMNLGWFAKRGVKAGSRLSGPAFTR